MTRMIFVMLLSATLLGVQTAATPKSARAETETIVFSCNEPELYPRREAVSLQSLERLSDGIGTRLILRSDMAGFSSFESATGDAPFRPADGNAVVVQFVDNHQPDTQKTTTRIRAKDSSGRYSREYKININFYPKELYAASGLTAPNYVIVQESDIGLAVGRVEDWIVDRATAEDVQFARQTWGKLLADVPSPAEKARRLARAILEALIPHQGIPSDKMKTNPFEQYRRAASGQDHVWCENLSNIFVRACAAFDIPARQIGLYRPSSEEEGYSLMMAEGHTTVEVFDEAINRWVWLDLDFSVLGMELAGYGPVNLAEFRRYLNDPVLVKGLRVVIYDPKTHSEKAVPVLESEARHSLFNYFKPDQTLLYYRKLPE
jgi:hypothetical protein